MSESFKPLLLNETGQAIAAELHNISEKIGGGTSGGGMVSITYAELKALRDNSQLVAGTSYRIVDYECTTTQENTKSAGHPFDIIVFADDEKTLNENARACKSELKKSKIAFIKIYQVDKIFKMHYIEEDSGSYLWADYDGELGDIYAKSNSLEVGDKVYDSYNYTSEAGEVVEVVDYFATTNLAAWELKYSLDNDTERFAWARQECLVLGDNDRAYRSPSHDGENQDEDWEEYNYAWETKDGKTLFTLEEKRAFSAYDWDSGATIPVTYCPQGKGVIYHMKDEWNNECPYDFKNIMFLRKLTDGAYDPQNGTDTFVYTFNGWDRDDASCYDVTATPHNISEQTRQDAKDDGDSAEDGDICFGNVIKKYYLYDDYGYQDRMLVLNDIVFLGVFYDDGYDDGWDSFNCYSNTFGDGCRSNTFGNSCYSNTFGDGCRSNTFGNSCYSNTFGDGCRSNTFGNSCYHNTFGDGCYSNTFGDDCYHNTFGNSCFSNTFGDGCYSNTFGDDCYHNTFGGGCRSNTFGNDCYHNTFGNSSAINYCRCIALGDGVQYCKIYGATATSSAKCLQNIRIAQGLKGTSSSNKLAIAVATNLTYETYVGKNTSGTLVIKNLLD